MRIVSQDMCNDIPYEMAHVAISRNEVYATVIGEKIGTKLGGYNSAADAEYALRFIWDAYSDGCSVYRLPTADEMPEEIMLYNGRHRSEFE